MEALDLLTEARCKVSAGHAALDELNFGVRLLQSEPAPIADMLSHEKASTHVKPRPGLSNLQR